VCTEYLLPLLDDLKSAIFSICSFVPVSAAQLHMRRLSSDDVFSTVTVGSSFAAEPELSYSDYVPGKYVACLYDGQWFIGNIKDRSDEHSDVLVTFMKRSLNDVFSWPARTKDECWVPFQHIICTVNAPIVHGMGARNYKISDSDLNKIIRLFATIAD